MTLHLIKLCVGCESIDDLRSWIELNLDRFQDIPEPGDHFHVTRMVPRRQAELLDGGSLYWVIKGRLACRQQLMSITEFTDEDGINRCRLGLSALVIPVAAKSHRPFQGWRYLNEENAPKDINSSSEDEFPEHLRRDLSDLGLL